MERWVVGEKSVSVLRTGGIFLVSLLTQNLECF